MNEKRYPIYTVWGIAAVWLIARIVLCFMEESPFDPILTLLFCAGPPLAAAACHLALRRHRAFLIAMPWTTLAVNPLNWLVLGGGAVLLVVGLGKTDGIEDWAQAIPLLLLYVSYLLTHVATAVAVFVRPRLRTVAAGLFLLAAALEAYPMVLLAQLTDGAVVMLYPDFIFPNLLGAFAARQLRREVQTEAAKSVAPKPDAPPPAEPEDPLTTEARQAYAQVANTGKETEE